MIVQYCNQFLINFSIYYYENKLFIIIFNVERINIIKEIKIKNLKNIIKI